MNMTELTVKSPLAALTAFVSYLLGTVNELVIVLLFLMTLDMFSGLIRAWLTKSVNSSYGLKGILKKVLMIMVVGVSAAVEFVLIHIGMETNSVVTVMVTCFFIVNESISVIENAAQVGLPVPSALMDVLEKINLDSGKERRITKRKKA